MQALLMFKIRCRDSSILGGWKKFCSVQPTEFKMLLKQSGS